MSTPHDQARSHQSKNCFIQGTRKSVHSFQIRFKMILKHDNAFVGVKALCYILSGV